jgi:hypothetical protein
LLALNESNAPASAPSGGPETGEQAAICAAALGEAADFVEAAPLGMDVSGTVKTFHDKGLGYAKLVKQEISAHRFTLEKSNELFDSTFLLSQTKQGYREGIVKECLVLSDRMLKDIK